ncbi:MAG: leucine-rich repeat protein [Clostridia bacterium]|nr:leucine-rich repeat protein [Clostridia bacterium]
MGDPILGICNAGITNEVDLGTPEIPDGYELAGWYLDEELTTPATFPLSIQQTNSQLYAKLEEGYPEGNLPSDWLAWDSTNSYYVKKGTSTLPTELIIPKTYNDGTNGMANVTRIQYNAFQNSSVITSITIPNSLTEIVLSTFSGCTELQTVIFESESQIASIGNNAFKNCTK